MNVPAFISGLPILARPTTNGARSGWCPAVRSNQQSNVSRSSSNVRMKLLNHEKLEVILESGDGQIAKYKLNIEIPGDYSKKKRRESVQAMKKNANFPGFRKGTIPPFMFGEIDIFVFRDSAEEMIDEAVKELDLSRTEGDNQDAVYDANEIQKTFKVGHDFSFDCEVVLSAVRINDAIDVEKLEPIVADSDIPTGLDLDKLEPQSQPTIDQAASSS